MDTNELVKMLSFGPLSSPFTQWTRLARLQITSCGDGAMNHPTTKIKIIKVIPVHLGEGINGAMTTEEILNVIDKIEVGDRTLGEIITSKRPKGRPPSSFFTSYADNSQAIHKQNFKHRQYQI